MKSITDQTSSTQDASVAHHRADPGVNLDSRPGQSNGRSQRDAATPPSLPLPSTFNPTRYPSGAIAPGVYPSIEASRYHALVYASKTYLSQMLRSPAHAKWAIDNPCEQTPALRIGSAVHCLTLEGEDEYQK